MSRPYKSLRLWSSKRWAACVVFDRRPGVWWQFYKYQGWGGAKLSFGRHFYAFIIERYQG